MAPFIEKGAFLMTIEKSIDLTATGRSIDEAVAEAVHRASLTLEGVSGFEIERIDGLVDGGEITYRVLVRVSFAIKERIHE
ncbi:MAG TPA: dodecin family protein [Actinomycetota bacterium]|nr:dodecin family protein [Actinomycetota bacterium]